MDTSKRGELSQLIGETITSYRVENSQSLRIVCESGRVFSMTLDDDGACGNDSHAFFGNVTLITDHRVTAVRELEKSNDGAKFVVECKYRAGVIEVIHSSNGWYSWSHEVTEITPASPTP
jgi:hypothetical protein